MREYTTNANYDRKKESTMPVKRTLILQLVEGVTAGPQGTAKAPVALGRRGSGRTKIGVVAVLPLKYARTAPRRKAVLPTSAT